jgi:Trp operon repressor
MAGRIGRRFDVVLAEELLEQRIPHTVIAVRLGVSVTTIRHFSSSLTPQNADGINSRIRAKEDCEAFAAALAVFHPEKMTGGR